MDKRTETRMNRLGFTGKMRRVVAEINETPGVDGLLLGNYKGGTCYADGHCQVKNNGSLVVILSNGKGGAVPVTIHTKQAEHVYGILSERYDAAIKVPKNKPEHVSPYISAHMAGIEDKLQGCGHTAEKRVFELNGHPKEGGVMYHGADGNEHCFSIIEPQGNMRHAMRVKYLAFPGLDGMIEKTLRDYSREML